MKIVSNTIIVPIDITQNKTAQGTIEYLVIIGIVITISLVVVGLVITSSSNASQTGTKISDIQMKTSPVALTEGLSTSAGDYLLMLRNNSGDGATITGVTVNGVTQANLSRYLQSTGQTNITVVTGTPCTTGQTTTANITINYTSNEGLPKTQNYSNIQIPCQSGTLIQPTQVAQLRTLYHSTTNDFTPTGYFLQSATIAPLKPQGQLDWNTTANYTYLSNDYNRDMNGLILYYKFNELNSSSKLIDYARYDNNVTLVGATIKKGGLWDTNKIYFDGIDDYIDLNSNLGLSGTKNFSISVWVNDYVLDGFRGIFGSKIDASGQIYLLGYQNTVRFGIGGQEIYSSPVSAKGWHNIAATYDGTYSRLYYDGISVASPISATGAINSGNFIIGNDRSYPSRYFNGEMDELKVYNRTLSATEIQADYNRGRTDSNYVSPIIDTAPTIGTTDYNYLIFNTNNGIDKNGYSYGSQIEPTKEIDLNNGLVGLWHLNSNANDSSNYGNNGTWSGTTTYATGLWNTNAGSFNGASYINIGDVFYTGNNVTVSAWINSSTASGVIVGKDAANAREYTLDVYNNAPRFYSDGTGAWGATGDSRIPLNTWIHLVGTHNSNGLVELYVNGTLDKNVTMGTTIPNTSTSLRIGNRVYVGSESYFNGKIEDVAIWNRALDANTIKELFNKGAARLGVKYRSCESATSCTRAWSDANYSANTLIPLDSIDGNQYFQYAVYPTLYQFPDGNYLSQAFATLRDVNISYTN